MCELLGLSLKRKSTPRISFKAFRGRAHQGPGNPDGWGIAWYPDGKAASVIKEEIPADTSRLASFLGAYDRLCSRTFIAHVRKTSRGGVVYRNTHPFLRELDGHDYTFAHNGTLRGYEDLDLGSFRPVGETDSERLFCRLLSVIRNIGGIASPDECTQLWDALLNVNQLASNGIPSKLNMLLSDGETLIAYRDMYGKGKLHRLERPECYSERVTILEDGDYRIQLPVEKGETQAAFAIATERLTDEDGWTLFQPGELCAFKMGRLFYSSASPTVSLCNIEVYDSSSWLDRRTKAPEVAGMPASLRSRLGVSIGEAIIVQSQYSSVKLTVYETDRRLLANGSCRAQNPEAHICLPSSIRERLGLTVMGTLRNTPNFTKIYAPVCVQSL